MLKPFHLLAIVALNVLIATGVYMEHKHDGYSNLVSDAHNIIGIAQKYDHPYLFKEDLFLNDINNVKYYTPFFVQPLRGFAWLANGDYVLGIVYMSVLLHLVFGILWFLLLYRMTNLFWVALLMSILIRGVVWLPLGEIWGISGIWTTMPRTVYIALMPLAFFVLFKARQYRQWLAALLIGLLFNFHPITGLGGILIFYMVFWYLAWTKHSIKKVALKTLWLSFWVVLGMLPFLATYFTKTEISGDYSKVLFQEALSARIPETFFNVDKTMLTWLKKNTLFFAMPLLLYLLLSVKLPKERPKAILLVTLTLVLFSIPNATLLIETTVNDFFSTNFRMAFQLVRIQKLAILPGYAAIAFLLGLLPFKRLLMPALCISFLVLLSVSNAKLFDRVPFLGNDIARMVLPDNVSLRNAKAVFGNADMDKMLSYIKENIKEDAVFFGHEIVRSGAMRSSVLDPKGASILIESNPKALIEWYADRKVFAELNSWEERIDFLKSKRNVTHLLLAKEIPRVKRITTKGIWKLYEL